MILADAQAHLRASADRASGLGWRDTERSLRYLADTEPPTAAAGDSAAKPAAARAEARSLAKRRSLAPAVAYTGAGQAWAAIGFYANGVYVSEYRRALADAKRSRRADLATAIATYADACGDFAVAAQATALATNLTDRRPN